MPQMVARIGDPITAGIIVGPSLAPNVIVGLDAKIVATVGTPVVCAIHGAGTITSSLAPNVLTGPAAQPIATVGSICSCGCVVVMGCPTVFAGS